MQHICAISIRLGSRRGGGCRIPGMMKQGSTAQEMSEREMGRNEVSETQESEKNEKTNAISNQQQQRESTHHKGWIRSKMENEMTQMQ
ncbi:MAG: hypothetical protein GY820_42490 [Gammaproteobacteria bacterium]|nr:hypothetical protein [Gammaproteobacteria bacterium]